MNMKIPAQYMYSDEDYYSMTACVHKTIEGGVGGGLGYFKSACKGIS